MQEQKIVLEMLKTNEYFLMTTGDGSEVYDENGNLFLYNKNERSILVVQNTEEIRRLYDLPLLTPEIKTTIRQDDLSKLGSLLPVMNDNGQEPDEDNEPEEVEVKPVIKRKRLLDRRPANEAFPSQALGLLTSLVSLPKYKKLLRDQSIPNKSKVWESIYKEMSKAGCNFGTSSKEGGEILAEKWRVVENLVLKKKSFKQRTLFTQDFRRALRIEIENRKARGSNYESPPLSPCMSQYAINRKPKSGEISPEAIELLLNLIQTDKYNNRFSKGSGKRTNRMWEELYDDLHSQGLDVEGKTKQEKVSRLFQKWRNMKRTFVKYIIEKNNGKDIRKPMFYEQMFNIFSKHILNKYGSECESEDDVKPNEWQEGSDSECSVDFMELDHSYSQSNVMSDVEESAEASGNIVLLPSAEPSTSNAALSLEVLQQIKSLNETALAMQQQNFSKITSLLDSLVTQQSRLTSVVSDYILSQSVRSRSKSRHKT